MSASSNVFMKILFSDPTHILPGEFPSKRLDKTSDFVKLLTNIRMRIKKLYPIETKYGFMVRLCNSSTRDPYNMTIVTNNAIKLHGREIDVTRTSF